jgi:hypothetical protein
MRVGMDGEHEGGAHDAHVISWWSSHDVNAPPPPRNIENKGEIRGKAHKKRRKWGWG